MSWLRKLLRLLSREPLPVLETQFLFKAKQRLNLYEECRAKRVMPESISSIPASTLASYAQQAAGIVEKEGFTRAPSLENEVRLLSLAVRDVICQLEEIDSYIRTYIHR